MKRLLRYRFGSRRKARIKVSLWFVLHLCIDACIYRGRHFPGRTREITDTMEPIQRHTCRYTHIVDRYDKNARAYKRFRWHNREEKSGARATYLRSSFVFNEKDRIVRINCTRVYVSHGLTIDSSLSIPLPFVIA